MLCSTKAGIPSTHPHNTRKTGLRLRFCDHCGQSVSLVKMLLGAHHAHTHTDERNFECQEVGKTFTQESHLNQHNSPTLERETCSPHPGLTSSVYTTSSNAALPIPHGYIPDTHNPLNPERYWEHDDGGESSDRRTVPGTSGELSGGLRISPSLQLLVALRYLATGNFQLTLADTADMSQPSVPRCLKTVVTPSRSCTEDHPVPTTQRGGVMQAFSTIAGPLPGLHWTAGWHSTSVRGPGGEEAELYRGRKGFLCLQR
ncbi:Zinc finger protein 530 [Chionoecetes opilio]|uniref:Zinc finger protein 530 n=1 Tax=Chionoecetes opilio TaxID=41210 RepID=A0A8J4XSK2_CHIOP|nr:Zinc finger protein 530 [Chionoecetes opilio]